MALIKAENLKLKLGDGATPETFIWLGEARSVSISYSGTPVSATHLATPDNWQQLLPGAGLATLRLSASGALHNEAIMNDLQTVFIAREARNWQVEQGSLSTLQGPFLITRLDLAGPYGREMTFSIGLASAGNLQFV